MSVETEATKKARKAMTRYEQSSGRSVPAYRRRGNAEALLEAADKADTRCEVLLARIPRHRSAGRLGARR